MISFYNKSRNIFFFSGQVIARNNILKKKNYDFENMNNHG